VNQTAFYIAKGELLADIQAGFDLCTSPLEINICPNGRFVG